MDAKDTRLVANRLRGRAAAASVAASLIALLLVAGCAAPLAVPRPAGVVPFGQHVTVIYVPGIGGVSREDRGWVAGLRAGGYDGNLELWDWTGRLGPIEALWAHARQRQEARNVAARIRQLRTESPAAPVVLAAHSAGAGVALEALTDLPPETRVDSLVLLAPAVSRTYDLTPALRHVRGRADVFYSDRDTLVLAIGTFVFGTVDGTHDQAAGHGGFVRPTGAAAAEAYSKLQTHPYSHARQVWGDDGGHEGVLAPGVAARVIAPLLPDNRAPDGAVADARD